MKAIANRIDRALDDALGMTFPASDPIAVFVPAALARPPDHEIGADLAGAVPQRTWLTCHQDMGRSIAQNP